MLRGSSRNITFPKRRSQIWVRQSSTLSDLHHKLTSRQLPLLYDYPTPTQSDLLTLTLADFLPAAVQLSASDTPPKYISEKYLLPPAHHLVYFPPPSRLSDLLPDGTDPDQSPGDPFVRRMWAGGRINFFPNLNASMNHLLLLGKAAYCLERITDVTVKGRPSNEKILVTIERRVSRVDRGTPGIHHPLDERADVRAHVAEDEIRNRLSKDSECSVIEHRNLVFMRERTPEAAADAATTPCKVVKPSHEPTFSLSITPTAALLFRFSALTFNAHRIHLDKQYCQEVEGHRNLLFHGPLSVVFMVEVLRRHLAALELDHLKETPFDTTTMIETIEYRNLAPLYAEEEMRVCGRAQEGGAWDVWIVGKDGGYAVKGTVTTRKVRKRLTKAFKGKKMPAWREGL